MPTFRIEKFDDYTHQDPDVWWQGFTTELGIHEIPYHLFISALFINTKGGCQIWLSHMATIHGIQVSDLYKKVSWEDMTKEWKKRFIVDDAPALSINRIFTMAQGSTPTRDWLTNWQKIVATPDLDLPFPHMRREFYNRSCAALSLALGNREQYNTFAEIINKAREIIKTNRAAAHEKSTWQPTYVEKYQAQDLSLPGSGQGGCATSAQLEKLSFAGGEATPPPTPPDSAALLAASYTSGEDANVASPRYTYEDYAVHLVPPLDQPLHVQQSTACTVSSPSATDSAASPSSTAGDSTTWSSLEKLDPLTFEDFQWMPMPRSGRLPKPHCNVLKAQLRDYLHTAVPTPLMDAGVEVVDLHAYIAKIDREFNTQRRSLEEQVEHLRTVLERLRQAKYKANRDKCEFARQEMEYLGHYVTPKGIRPLADKIEALRVWPEPTNTTDVRSFKGLAGYYQRFISGYSRIAAPMTRLQSPKVPLVFDDDARQSFQALKTAMLMTPVLSIYDPTVPTRVTSDASGYGIGAVLEQHDDDDWHPVEYFSHKVPPINSLDDARKELLAFVMALKRWRHFLLGRRRFTCVTDNNPLTYYKTQDTVSSTIGRWMYFIDQFDFTPKHLPGLSNRAVDALSRRPDLCAMTHHAFAFNEELQRHFIRAYESDPDFATLYAQLSSDHPPANHYCIVDGYLLLHSRGKDLLCVPRDRRLRTRLLEDIVSDRDTRFMSTFWTALMQESGTTMKPSSARHPQTDRQTERAHQTAQMMLRMLIRPDQKDWVDRFLEFEFAYNTSVHPAIGMTPFELHHSGRKDRIFVDLLLPRPAYIDTACSPASVRKYRELLTQARTNMQKAQVRMQQQANRRHVPCPIRAGDLVWVSKEEFALEQDVSRKLLPKWFGPWFVTAAVGDEPDGPSFLAFIETEEQCQLAAAAAQLQAEKAATAKKLRVQAEADADAQARRKEAQDLLQRHEANIINRLKFWHFEPNGDEATPKEQHKEFMAKLVTRLVYTCNHLSSELANLQRAVRNHKTQHEDATRALDARVQDLEQVPPGPDAGASSSASSSRQLEERVDHVVAMLRDISAFTESATISQRFELLDTKISQQQQTDHSHNNSSARPYKMLTFRIEKFDDYTHQDPVV
ncbi:hypothetical protein CBR_g40837 [Chara braunii]|uniref:Integrase catalytic domain-containing protein n=1 Tax=Chara braunii TaxID=69332 RepID=A0A388K266_CHABU|nr:hypothetical protein CBR_g40837 [Chara braunii]|eukprot:GBG64138.1 hypothetical protein CBR_g40837 [Chara braunii]